MKIVVYLASLCSLMQVIEAPLPNSPPDASITSHWLAIDGIQPSIPQNSPVQGNLPCHIVLLKNLYQLLIFNSIFPVAISDVKRSEYKDDGLPGRHVLSKELQVLFYTISSSSFFYS